jgi:hypothetical protein
MKAAAQAAFAGAEIARCAGYRARDLDDGVRSRVAARVRPLDSGLAEMVERPVVLARAQERFAFGDALPVGLRLAEVGEDATFPDGRDNVPS